MAFMQVRILPVLALFSLTLANTDAHSLETENYWNSVFPNAVMLKRLKDQLSIDNGNIGDDKYGMRYHFVKVHSDEETSTNQRGVDYHNTLWANSTDSSLVNQLLKLNETIYFFKEDLSEGKKMHLRFVSENGATFLPRHVADSIPFSSNKLPQILNLLSVKPESGEAKQIKKTLSICEGVGVKGEHKHCATSLESMIEFIVSELGTTSAKVLATEVAGNKNDQRQAYHVVGVKKAGVKSVVCHKLNYAYAVYYCHKMESDEATKSYGVSLVGAEGSKARALAVCHIDTSDWHPDFAAFKILNVKPGTVPICHFLAKDTLMWVAK